MRQSDIQANTWYIKKVKPGQRKLVRYVYSVDVDWVRWADNAVIVVTQGYVLTQRRFFAIWAEREATIEEVVDELN